MKLINYVRIMRNYHFWLILIITLAIGFLYHSIRNINLTDHEWDLLWRLVVFENHYNFNGILFYIPFIYATLIFWWKGLLIVWIVSMILIFPRLLYMTNEITVLVINGISLVIPLTIVISIALLIQWRKAEKEAFIARERGHRFYIAKIFEAQENERKRIARELHDDTTQRLWIVANNIMKLSKSISPETGQKFEPIKNAIMDIYRDTKKISHDLRPGILDNLGLEAALGWLADGLNDEDIKADVIVDSNVNKVPPKSEILVFRFVQEALNNVRKHSHASKVIVRLNYVEKAIKISVQDNGMGLKLPENIGKYAKEGKSGIIGMNERAQLLGGTFNITSESGQGTTVSLEFIPELATGNQ
jgi:signal transduction histidine kinase